MRRFPCHWCKTATSDFRIFTMAKRGGHPSGGWPVCAADYQKAVTELIRDCHPSFQMVIYEHILVDLPDKNYARTRLVAKLQKKETP